MNEHKLPKNVLYIHIFFFIFQKKMSLATTILSTSSAAAAESCVWFNFGFGADFNVGIIFYVGPRLQSVSNRVNDTY